MGDDSDSLRIMPLNSTNVKCSGTRAGRFLSMTMIHCPQGMVSKKLETKAIVKLPSSDVAVMEESKSSRKPIETTTWNACASVSAKSELDTYTKEQMNVKSILKEQNKKLYIQTIDVPHGSPGKGTGGTRGTGGTGGGMELSLNTMHVQQQKILEKKMRKEIESAILKLEEEMKV